MAGHTINYYFIMGVERDASPEEIKLAYRKLALKFHPDRNQGNPLAESRFKLVVEAYETLSNPMLRSEYDGTRTHRSPKRPASGKEGAGPADSDTTKKQAHETRESEVDRIFSGLDENLRQGQAGPVPIRGSDLRHHLTIDFKAGVFGTKREIHFQSGVTCRVCRGSGARADSRLTPCPACFGRGALKNGEGERMCDHCLGHGVLALDVCGACKGAGIHSARRRLTVAIPPGCGTGTRVRVPGEGEPGMNGGPSGDLLVIVTVGEHPLFYCQGPDIVCELPLSFYRAALGGEVSAPTIDGPVEIKLKPGVQHGDMITLPGRGVPSAETPGERGNHKFIISIEVPKKLSARQRELLGELESLENPDSLARSFRRKVRDILG